MPISSGSTPGSKPKFQSRPGLEDSKIFTQFFSYASSDSVFKSKKIREKFLLYYRILSRIEKGMYPSQIARQLGFSLQRLRYHIKKLEADGLIVRKFRSNFVFYEVTPLGKRFLYHYRKKVTEVKNFSLPVSSKNVRLHNLAIKFPILKDNPSAEWDRKVEINNWVKNYCVVTFPVGITIEKTSKHIIAHFHQFQTDQEMFLSEFYNWVLKGCYYVYYYLIREKGIQIDLFRGEIIKEHIANEHPELNDKIDPRKTVEISLGRKAQSIFPANFQAKAWIDRSLGSVDIETNDLLYEEKLLMMPETVHEIRSLMVQNIAVVNEFAKQIALHLEVMQNISHSLSQLNLMLSDLNKALKKLSGGEPGYGDSGNESGSKE